MISMWSASLVRNPARATQKTRSGIRIRTRIQRKKKDKVCQVKQSSDGSSDEASAESCFGYEDSEDEEVIHGQRGGRLCDGRGGSVWETGRYRGVNDD